MAPCQHFQQVTILTTDIHECAECIAMGSGWVHLRLCLNCGHVGCCDSSPNQHASKHVHAAGHPVVRSIEPDETWAYCYEDDAYVEDLAISS